MTYPALKAQACVSTVGRFVAHDFIQRGTERPTCNRCGAINPAFKECADCAGTGRGRGHGALAFRGDCEGCGGEGYLRRTEKYYYILIFTEPATLRRRTKCAACGKDLLKGVEVVRAYFSRAYYSRTRSYCGVCTVPDELEVEVQSRR